MVADDAHDFRLRRHLAPSPSRLSGVQSGKSFVEHHVVRKDSGLWFSIASKMRIMNCQRSRGKRLRSQASSAKAPRKICCGGCAFANLLNRRATLEPFAFNSSARPRGP